jgi:hypothetical protein
MLQVYSQRLTPGELPGFDSRQGQKIFSLPLRPDQSWGPSSPDIQWVSGALSSGGGGGLNVTSHLQLMPRLRMHGAIPSLLHTYSWSSASLNIGTTLPYRSIFMAWRRKTGGVETGIAWRGGREVLCPWAYSWVSSHTCDQINAVLGLVHTSVTCQQIRTQTFV